MSRKLNIGVCAVQGAFAEHCAALEKLGAQSVQVRSAADLNGIDGLILPGGESTAQAGLMKSLGIFGAAKQLIDGGLPVYGTCAGMILLAKEIESDTARHFGTMDITVKRNGYGRQLASSVEYGLFHGERIPMTFIRAPKICRAGPGVTILAEHQGSPAAARQGSMLATTFHPELTEETAVHAYFLSMIKK